MKLTREEALKLHKELRAFVGESPYADYGVKDRLRKIEFEFNYCSNVTTYFREKVFDAIHWVGIWCTERRWRKWGNDPSRLRGVVLNCLYSMESVIEQELSSSGEPVER